MKRIKPTIDPALLPSQDLVVVEWDDIKSEAGWEHEDQAKRGTPARCLTVGWIVQKDRKVVVVASDYGEGEWGSRTTIPRGVVRGIKTL